MELLADAVGPGEGQRQQAHQFGQARGIPEVGVLEIEAARFETAAQGFHLPAVGVGVEGIVGRCARGGEDEAFSIVQPQRREVNEAAPNRVAPRQPVPLAGFERTPQDLDLQRLVPAIGHQGVAFEALMEGNPSRLQPPAPRLAHDFAVGQQDGDPLHAKDREEALQEGDPLGGVGVAGLVQNTPEHRQSDAAIGDPQHQAVDVHRAERPVRAIQRQAPRAVADRDQAHQQPRPRIRVDLERAEEALQALVVRVHPGRAAKTGGQLGQIDAAHLEQRQQKLRQKTDPGAMPRQMFGQHGLEFADGVMEGGLHWSAFKKCLA